MNVPVIGVSGGRVRAASPAWIGRKGFAFRSLFEAGLDERGQVRRYRFRLGAAHPTVESKRRGPAGNLRLRLHTDQAGRP